MSHETPEAQPLDIREIIRVLGRRRWLLVLPWAVALLGGIAGAFLLPPIYESTVTLVLQGPQGLSQGLGMVNNIAPAAQADLMREQVRSSLFLNSVITAAGLKNDAPTRAWALKSVSRYPGLSEGDAVEAFLRDFLREAITVKLAKANVFQVIVADNEPERARRLAEAVSNQFVASSRAAQLQAISRTQEFSTEQQQIYKDKLDASEQRLESYRRNILSTSIVGSVNAGNVARAHTQLDQARLEEEDLQQRIADLRRQLAGKARDEDIRALSTPEVLSLSAQLGGLERQLASATLGDPTGDGPNSLKLSIVRKHEELISELSLSSGSLLPNVAPAVRDLIVGLRVAQADLGGVVARRDWLDRQVSAYERDVVMTPEHELEMQRLTADAENNRALYNSFLQQSSAAQIAEAFQNAKLSGRFEVMEPAQRPLQPARPNRPVLILLALIAGGVVGVGTVLVVERHDESVRNAEEVENLLGLPVLGAIPRVAELQAQRRKSNPFTAAATGVPTHREHGMLHRLKVESPLGLEFRRVYLKLAKSRTLSLPHTLAVTSATRGEGKTTAAACLAITLARELRQKVLLVDFDLRSPALHRALGLPSSSWGLAQILAQRHFDERFVRSTVLPHLEFLPAGKSDRPAAELIESEVVDWFVREAAARYPLVIMDCAPNLAVPDPLILGRAAEGVLYVIKAGTTVRKAAEYGVRVQREARDNILGVLINDAGEFLPHYYGYGYRSYGYADEAAGADS